MNATVEETQQKTPVTRLLDMLAGWSEYIEHENGKYPDTLSNEQIGALYQEAGAIAERDYGDIENEQNAVCRFVTERVIAALLKE